MPHTNLRPAVFLDRDGVIIEDTDYVGSLEEVRILPGVLPAIRRLNDFGFPLVVVTNQSGVARGLFPESMIGAIHEFLQVELAQIGARIDRFEYCPHHAVHGQGAYRIDCDCRKPKPGMLQSAAGAMGLDLSRSWLVGDRITDLQAGAAAGCRTILVRTGYGSKTVAAVGDPELNLIGIVPSLVEAVDRILATSNSGK
jgi:D-glycero-D-manno-heptose 1,7-bisphosphate phosphatase